MEINWFEIVAQIINFAILLIILKKLLYKPVMKVMKNREDAIAESLNHADQKIHEAQALIESYEQKLTEIQGEEETILKTARQEALQIKESLIESYRNEAEEKRIAFLNDLKGEKEQFVEALRQSLGENAVKLAGHVLTSISEEEIEKMMFDTFIEDIKNLNSIEDSGKTGGEQEKSHGGLLTLRSAKELSEDDKRRLEKTVNISDFSGINYKVDQSLVIGYELKFETFTISSNIKKYLEESEKNVLKILDEQLE